LPQACNDPAAVESLKGGSHRSAHGGAIRRTNDGFQRDVLSLLSLGTDTLHRERLNGSLGSRVEADRRVLLDDGTVECSRRHEELKQRLLLDRGGTARQCGGP
jgi:hypothetical protein